MTSDNTAMALECSPKEMYFKSLSSGEKQKTHLTLSNPTTNRYAFKVKTTCPKCYVVKPSVGFLEPESTFKIVIIKQRNPKPSVVDKFLIEAMTTSERRANANASDSMKIANKDVRLIKVPVLVEGQSLDMDSSKVFNVTNEAADSVKQVQGFEQFANVQAEEKPAPTPTPSLPQPQTLPQSTSMMSTSNSIVPVPTVDAMPSTTARDGLVVMNNDLTFRYNAGGNVISYIRLYNPSDDRLAFKIKNTFPRGFKVKPPQGFIKPRTALDVEVLLLNSKGVDFSYAKFLVQSFVVDFTDEIITDAMYHKAKLYKAVREIELDVKLVGFEEVNETQSSNSVTEEKTAAAAYEIRYLRKQLIHMETELQSLKQEVAHKNDYQSRKSHKRVESADKVLCVGCMHSVPLFRMRKSRRHFRAIK